jgi:hypothetical protein
MKKIIILLIISILLISCSSNKQNSSSTSISDKDIYVGTKGLSLEFMDNAPPSEIFDSETIPIIVLVKNRGSFAANGQIEFPVDGNLVPTDNKEKESFQLYGRSMSNIVGEEKKFIFYRKAQIFDDTETMPTLIRVKASYKYQTNAIIPICIDTDPYNEFEYKGIKKACQAKNINLDKGQGAPVAVTKIEPIMQGSNNQIKPKFRIFVKNVGEGFVSSLDEKSKQNIVQINAFLTNEDGLEEKLICDFEKFDISKKTSILCSSNNTISKTTQPYTSLIKIKLDYNYANSITKEIRMKKVI